MHKTVQGNPKICPLEANSAVLTADGRPPGRLPTVGFPTAGKVGRSAGRPLGHCPIGGRPAGQPTFLTVENPTVGSRPGGRPSAVRAVELASNGQIFGAYKLGLPWAVLHKIFGEFQSQFFHLYWRFSQLILGLILSYPKESFSSVFSKEILLSFSPQIYSSFSHTYLSFLLLYQSYRELL